MSYLVMDMETVPDSELWKPTEPAKGSRKKAPEDQFPPLYAHRPVAVGYMLLNDDLVVQDPSHFGCAGGEEIQLLTGFSGWMNSVPATLVTWNGRGFDLPVLSLRSFRHGLALSWNTANHRKRYSEDPHLDLMGALTDWSPRIAGYSVDAFCSIIGLPGKGDERGKAVAGMYAKGEYNKIYGLCTCDVGRTAFLLFRYLLMRGRIDIDKYRNAARNLLQLCTDRHLTGVTFGADPARLLLEAPDAVVLAPPAQQEPVSA